MAQMESVVPKGGQDAVAVFQLVNYGLYEHQHAAAASQAHTLL